MKPLVSLRAAFDDPALLAPVIGGDSREPMRALLLASHGEELTDSEREHFRRLTGREREPLARVEELHVLAGRRAGKSSGCASLAVYAASLCDHSDCLSPGERGVVLLVAENQRQAKILLRYIEGAFDASPALRKLIVNRTATSLSLDNRIDIEVRACDFRGVRGLTLVGAICDEICHWRSDDSANPDTEVVDAIRPGLITTRGQLVTIGSPYAKRGFAYQTFARDYGADGDARILVARGGTREFNSTVDQAFIDRAVERDPLSAASEWLGQFRNDVAGWLSADVIEAAVDRDVAVRPPGNGRFRYVAGVDPSGGARDSFTCAVAHAEDGAAVLDTLIEIRPPFNPTSATAQIAGVLKSYGLSSAVGDKYAAQWVVDAFAKVGIRYQHSERDRSRIYLDAMPLFTSGRARLLDNARLITQFSQLERRTSNMGRDVIDHGRGGHDDLCNAASLAMVLAVAQQGARVTVEPLRNWGF